MPFTIYDLKDRLDELGKRLCEYDEADIVPRPVIELLCSMEDYARKHGNDDDNKSCLERVEPSFASTYEDLTEMFARLDGDIEDDDEYEDAYDRMAEYALSVEPGHIQLSWGGPSAGFRFDADGNHVKYYFLDWFDGATIDIDTDRYPLVARFIDYFTEGLEDC